MTWRDRTGRDSGSWQLLTSEKHLKEVLESVPLVAVFLDLDGRVTYANRHLVTLTGYGSPQLVGASWFEQCIPGDQRDRVSAQFFGEVAQGGVAPREEYEIVTREGERRLISWSNTVHRDSGGRMVGTLGVGVDLTERVRAEAAEARLRTSIQRAVAEWQLAVGLIRGLDSSELLESIVRRGATLLGTPHGGIYVPGGSDAMQLRILIGGRNDVMPASVRRGEGTVGRAWAQGRAATLREQPDGDAGPGPSDLVAVPLRSGRDTTGLLVLAIADERRAFTKEEIEILERYSTLASIALDNARLYEAMALQLEEKRRVEDELKQERDFALQVMGRMGQGLVTTDMTGRVEYANPAFARMVGQRSDGMLGRRLEEIFGHGAQRTENTGSYELSFHRSGGEAAHVLVTLAPRLREGRLAGSIGVITDLTERKRAELAQSEARRAAEGANRAKSEFLARMSHDIRTPLHSMLGFTEILKEKVSRRGDAELIGEIARIETAMEHMLGLISGLLDVSSIEAGRIQVRAERLDVALLLKDVASTIAPLLGRGGNELRLEVADDAGDIQADGTKLRQCLFNLLGNAAKATNRGVVTLRARREGAEIVFEVSDTGRGVDAERLAHLLSEAGGSVASSDGGSGLGLRITRSLGRAMGGTLSAESVPGGGSTFRLRLPCAPPSAGPAAPRAVEAPATRAEAAPSPRGRALVVDDDASSRALLEHHLRREGFEVLMAVRGEDALRIAQTLRPSIITLDVVMPGMDGWAVLAALRRDPMLAGVPVVMTTSVDDEPLALAMGASALLVKPVDPARLTAIVKNYVGQVDAVSAEATGPCVLLVEDDAATQEWLGRMLRKEGFRVVIAGDGRAALAAVSENLPDAIVLDLMLPRVDGFELLRDLQKTATLKSIPIVIQTAVDLRPADRAALSPAVTAVLRKGRYRASELVAEVATALARR